MSAGGWLAALRGTTGPRGDRNDRGTPASLPRAFPSRHFAGLALSVAIFALAVAAGLSLLPARARGDEAASEEPLGPTAAQTKAFLESGRAGAMAERPETDLHAAQTMPHRELDRGEALELAEAVFEPELEAVEGIYEQFESERFLSNYAAVVSASSLSERFGRGQAEGLAAEHPETPVLVESMLPLRTEGASGEEEAVDLELERSGGGLQPQNPLAEVDIPDQLGEGISLPESEIDLTVAGAPEERTATDAGGEFAFYPEVAEDSDLIVAPTPRGVETMTDIRSAEAPTRTTYDLELPAGAVLRATQEGGAEVAEGDRTTLLIPAPTATDAAGNPVQTELIVSGDSITVAVTPSPSTAYPILVDPTFITEEWHWTLQHDSLAAWEESTTNRGAIEGFPYEAWEPNVHYPGLDLTSGIGQEARATDQATWAYWLPRYRADLANFGNAPSSWVYEMSTEGVLFLPYGNYTNYPVLVFGLVDAQIGWQAAESWYGGQGELNSWSDRFRFLNENPTTKEHDTHDKGAAMNLITYESGFPPRRDTYMADATIAVVDEDAPKIPRLNPPAHWVNATAEPIEFEFEDTGLGVRSASISFNGTTESGWGLDLGCSGTNSSPCPRKVKSFHGNPGEAQASLSYNPASLPTGYDPLTVTVGDVMSGLGAAGHTASRIVEIPVDHTPPSISLSGSLTEQSAVGTHRASYSLRVNAKDGVAGAPESGIKNVEILVDGKKVVMPEESEWAPNCQSENCSSHGEWTMNASEYTAGKHEVKVTATDAVGNVLSKTLYVELNPPPPSLSLSGTMTEQATLGTERTSYNLHVSASALTESPAAAVLPTYVSSFGAQGSGSGQFVHTGAMAIDAKGNLWVVDSGNDRIEEFNGGGAYVSQIDPEASSKCRLNRPTAVAFNEAGDLWVTDSGDRRVVELGTSGACLGEFGGAGTTAGKFAGSGPEAIAIDYHGNIWVADTYGGRLEKFNENGVFIRSVSTRGNGPEQLGEPVGIAIAPGGNVYVTDWEDDKVAEYGEGGAFIRQFGSQGSEAGQLQQPTGIAIDSRGDVWVADQNNGRVEEFTQAGQYLGHFGAKGTGAAQFELGYPTGIVTDAAGDLWITDTGDDRVEKWNSPNYLSPMAAYDTAIGTKGTTAGYLEAPIGVAADPKGDVWTLDSGTDLLQKYNAKGEYQTAYGGSGTEAGKFKSPRGLTIGGGHIWVADAGNNRIEEFSESGAYLSKFGEFGTANGQLKTPGTPAVDSSHHIWVPDKGNNRVEEFTEAGVWLRTISTWGTTGALNLPEAVAVGPGNTIFVADTGHNRVVEFSETGTFIRTIGAAGEPGPLTTPTSLYMDKNGDLWVLEVGADQVKEYTTSGAYLGWLGAPGTGAEDLDYPMDVSGDESGHLFVADMFGSRIDEWTNFSIHSQISAEVTVDGARKQSYEMSCMTKSCGTSGEWTLSSPSLEPGPHVVKVMATDGLGNTTTKTLNITVGDTKKPTLEAGGELASAPEGWIEQAEGNYGLHASATDSGYGVTRLVFSIDGNAVATKAQSCPAGACSATISTTVNAHELTAGAHPAEVVATDGAGNVTTKKWTVNVDPEGKISVEEAEATFEALETTAPVNLIGKSDEEGIEGTAPGLSVEEVEGELQAIGGTVPVSISSETGGEMEIEVAGETAFIPTCDESEAPSEPGPEPTEDPTESSEPEECTPVAVAELRAAEEEEEVARGEKTLGREPITITPVGAKGTETTAVDGVSVVTPNTGEAVDAVTRPLTDGGLTFEDIRSPAAPEHYAFELAPYSARLELRQVSSTVITAFYKETGNPAFTLEAVPASDADGREVPTHLTLSGPLLVTLTVEHRGVAAETGQPFVYPVVSGTGWQGGWFFGTVERYVPEEEKETEEEEFPCSECGGTEVSEGESTHIEAMGFSAPIHTLLLVPGPNGVEYEKIERAFAYEDCRRDPHAPEPPGSQGHGAGPGVGIPPGDEQSGPPRVDILGRCKGRWYAGGELRWATATHGHFFYTDPPYKVWAKHEPKCGEWGPWPEFYPKEVHCQFHEWETVKGESDNNINVDADWRFPEKAWGREREEVCVREEGSLPLKPFGNPETIFPNLFHEYKHSIAPGSACDWGHF
jgi:sugar lactone lactonase YvrE